MKFATYRDGTLDGRLMIVSRDGQRAVPADGVARSLLEALQRWPDVEAALLARAEALNAGRLNDTDFDPHACTAPLPRAPQWLDGSAFLNHGLLLEQAFKTPPIPDFKTLPLMYQGASDDFLGPHDDVPLPSEADGIDFEGEFGVVVGATPMGVSPEQAAGCIRLLVLINDWSLRAFGPREMRSGFGFVHAKPSTAFAPLAVTPDELGSAWQHGRVLMQLHVWLNDSCFGQPHGGEMDFPFGQLIAHAARTRRLSAGTIIGSGTVSNKARSAGSACIAEQRVIEQIDEGQARTPFMRFGDRVRMEARSENGRPGPFGTVEQTVVPVRPSGADG